MPLQINDSHFGDKAYYDKRREMMSELNPIADNAYLQNANYYPANHAITAQRTSGIKQKYPEQFADLQEQNTNAKIRALNELDFIDSNPKHANNPVAQLGAQDANTQLRIPMAWADNHPTYGDGQIRGFYLPNADTVTMPMHTMLGANAGGANTLTHETMHRGFNKLGNPDEKDRAHSEHNYIYNNMLQNYTRPHSFSKQDINQSWPSRPGFTYEPEYSQDAFNKKRANEFETLARKQLGS